MLNTHAFQAGNFFTKESHLAADPTDASEQVLLARMYYLGEGVPQDFTEAVKWFRLAANQGVAFAQYSLGVAYDFGTGVPKDFTEAVKWYRLAAAQGYALAQFNLGLMYARGTGVPEDYVQAYKWWNLAAAAGNADAKNYKRKVAEKMTKEHIAEAQRLSTAFKPTTKP